MSRVNFLICTAIAVICISFWALLNRPEQEPPWPSRIQGFSFSPFQQGQSAIDGLLPSEAEIDSDLALLADKTKPSVVTFSVQGVLSRIPAMARKHKLNVTLGAWISADLERNEAEIATVIQLTRENWRNVMRVVVGNGLCFGRKSPLSSFAIISIGCGQAFVRLAARCRSAPRSLARLDQTSGARQHVDFVATHMLPYWEGIQMGLAVDYIVDHINLLKDTFPDKPVVITEVGWPSNGRTRKRLSHRQPMRPLF